MRFDRMIGRRVLALNHRSIGRVEECRVERRAGAWEVTAYVIGPAGLWARLGLGLRLLYGAKAARGYLARWDQIDVTDPTHPRLTCSIEQVKRL